VAKTISVQSRLVSDYGMDEEGAERAVREYVMDYPLTFREADTYTAAEDIYQEYVLGL
jgi:hypothetical protein